MFETSVITELKDALLRNGATPSPEMLADILDAVGANYITPQQFAVLRCAIAGESDKQIAGTLDLHLNTVQLHWREIRERLGIASRLQLGAHVVATCVNTQVHMAIRPCEASSKKGKKI